MEDLLQFAQTDDPFGHFYDLARRTYVPLKLASPATSGNKLRPTR